MDLWSQSTLKSVDVTGELLDKIGKINVVQEYLSTNSHPLEIKYMFTLDSSAIITDVKLQKNDTMFVGVLQEKYTANKNYDEAIVNKELALLVEKNNDIYTIKCGNIEPHTKIIITYSYITILDNIDDYYLYVLPTNIAPRYNDNTLKNGYVSQITYSSTISYAFNLNFTINSNNKIHKMECNNHVNILKLSETSYQITGTTSPSEGDFVIKYCTDILPTIYRNDDHYYFNFNFPQTVSDVEMRKYSILIDRSGSMNGQKIIDARESLRFFVNNLPEESLFNIYGFGSSCKSMWDFHLNKNVENVKQATSYIEHIQADFGGTELFSCVRQVIDGTDDIYVHNQSKKNNWTIYGNNTETTPNVKKEQEHILIIITDGQIDSAIVQYLKNKQNIRIFCLGIGQDCNRNILNEISDVCHGVCRILNDSTNLKQTLIKFMDVINCEYYTNITINGEKVLNVAYPTMAISLFGCYNETCKEIKYQCKGKLLTSIIPEKYVDKVNSNDKFISQLYINNILNTKTHDEQVKLSIQYSILTNHTSFFLHDTEKISNTQQLLTENIEHYSETSLFDYGISYNTTKHMKVGCSYLPAHTSTLSPLRRMLKTLFTSHDHNTSFSKPSLYSRFKKYLGLSGKIFIVVLCIPGIIIYLSYAGTKYICKKIYIKAMSL